ncbi:transposase [Paraburkholderia sp. RL18-101-BIB-B]|uniref:transposase n=1 Tax=Paraburkholderia sp. RL18-101-BIB-B TaxID=3031634 RepID=UPI0038B7844A
MEGTSGSGRTHQKTITREPQEFMRRFPLHLLPASFHRFRHSGLLANAVRQATWRRYGTSLRAPAASRKRWPRNSAVHESTSLP